jgi:thiol-disulfide isomerase/thioredoxin
MPIDLLDTPSWYASKDDLRMMHVLGRLAPHVTVAQATKEKTMAYKMTLRHAAFDILSGFLALCLVLAFVVLHRTNDLQLFSLMTAILFFLAGVLRGARGPQNPLLTAFLIGLGGILPVFAMRVTGVALTEQGYVPLFVALSFCLALAGLEASRMFFRGRRKAALLFTLLSFVVATLVIGFAIPLLMDRWSSQEVNRPAPAFSFTTFDGKPVTSADVQGHVVVLAFWATWCVPCRQELPELQNIYDKYRENSNVVFYAVGGPWGGDTVDKESAFAKQMGLNLPLAFGSPETRRALGISGFPALIILDGAGHIRLVHSGYDASEHLARRVSEEVGAIMKTRS